MHRPVYTQLNPHILSEYIPYRDILGYTGIYIDRKGIYRVIRGITQYIRIGKIKIIAGFKYRTSCILHSCSYHCTTSVDTLLTFRWY